MVQGTNVAVEAWAILVAAGRGERMGGERPKALVTLRGRTLLEWALRACQASRTVAGIVVVGPPGELEACRAIASEAALWKPVECVGGGAERQDSVRAGLGALPRAFAGVVLVHDAARPLAAAALFDAVADAAARLGAAIPVVPLVDTIKRVKDGLIVETVDRAELYGAQTPQGFQRHLLEDAYDEAFLAGARLTDEAVALERMGDPVAVIPGAPTNRKITTPDDLRWAEDLLARGEEP